MRRIREEINRNEERFRQLSDKVDKNIITDAEMAAELQGLQAGEETRGSNDSQTGDCCLEALWQQITAVCAAAEPGRCSVPKVQRKWSHPGAMLGRDERRRNSEDEQEQGSTSQQLVLPSSGGLYEGSSE